jgi:uncharacterized membrane protein YsdA (DUF1294 family)
MTILISLSFFLCINVFSLLIYIYDKHAARQHKQRIAERQLHLLALCGGWPAALLTQQLLHHKNKKKYFVGWTYFLALLNVLLVFALWWNFR